MFVEFCGARYIDTEGGHDRMEKWLTANEIAQLLSVTKRPLNIRANREGWPYRSYAVRGGHGAGKSGGITSKTCRKTFK
jgi:hypothetical protein